MLQLYSLKEEPMYPITVEARKPISNPKADLDCFKVMLNSVWTTKANVSVNLSMINGVKL